MPHGGVEENWARFRLQFAAAGWVAFSDVVFTPDRTDALVYHEGRCGGTHGVGAFVWLRLNASESAWEIRRVIVSWIS